jgi:hypothetical protein
MTTDELLLKMISVLWNETRKCWQARAKGCSQFGLGKTPRDAMLAALSLDDDEL